MSKTIWGPWLALVLFCGCEEGSIVESPRPEAEGVLNEVLLSSPYIASQPTLKAGGREQVPSYFAYLPPDSPGPLPVLYLLHDLGQDHSAFPHFNGIASLLDALLGEGLMRPHLVIMPNGLTETGGGFYRDSLLPGEVDPLTSQGFGPWGMQLLQIMEDAEARFATATDALVVAEVLEGGGTSRGRSLGGIGMGAYGAFLTAVRAPVFSALLLHSGPLDLQGGLLTSDPELDGRWGDVLLRESELLVGSPLLVPESAALRGAPEAPLTTLLFAMAAAFSPARGPLDSFDMAAQMDTSLAHADPDGDPANNFQYPLVQVAGATTPEDPADDVWLGVWLPIQADGGVVDGVLLRWTLLHDPFYLASEASSMAGLVQAQTRVWVDAGVADEFGYSDDNERFAEALSEQLDADHVFAQSFAGGHADQLRERLALSLPWLSAITAAD